MSDLETEELEWFPDRRPAAALVRQMREKHRKPTNSAAHARPWRFLIKPRVGRNSLLFQEDEPLPALNFAFDSTIQLFPLTYLCATVAGVILSPIYPWGSDLVNRSIYTGTDRIVDRLGAFYCRGLPSYTEGRFPYVAVKRELLWPFALAVVNTSAAKRRFEDGRHDLVLYFALPKGVEIPTEVLLPANISVTNRSFPGDDGTTRTIPEECVLEVRPRDEEVRRSANDETRELIHIFPIFA